MEVSRGGRVRSSTLKAESSGIRLHPFGQGDFPVQAEARLDAAMRSHDYASMGLLISLVLLFTLTAAPAIATEEPAFSVTLKAGDIEVRDYPPLIAAEVTVGGDRNEAGGAGFRQLASYIFGGNVKKRGIAMTAPVVQAEVGNEMIAMTAPVTQSGGQGRWVVQFIMPRAYTLATLPTPTDARVHLKALPPSRLAVVRFSGLAGEADVKKQTATLEAFITEHHLREAGAPSLARYDPPWTPWFMRRNEVWIPIQP